jgi:hypothetical protein
MYNYIYCYRLWLGGEEHRNLKDPTQLKSKPTHSRQVCGTLYSTIGFKKNLRIIL